MSSPPSLVASAVPFRHPPDASLRNSADPFLGVIQASGVSLGDGKLVADSGESANSSDLSNVLINAECPQESDNDGSADGSEHSNDGVPNSDDKVINVIVVEPANAMRRALDIQGIQLRIQQGILNFRTWNSVSPTTDKFPDA
jgi:hypothetical protein